MSPDPSLDGRNLPQDFLSSIVPVDNILAYKTSKPDQALIQKAEERKLEILVRHLGWHDHFKDTHNKYRIPYLMVLDEQSGAFPDASLFKQLLLSWARENLKGFSIFSFKGAPWPQKKTIC